MSQPSLFSQKIWDLAASIPPGRVTTYGRIAKAAGGGGQAARSVSSILAKAPKAYNIPWHRIVYACGRVWTSPQYNTERLKLYKKEGITIGKQGKIQNFEEILWEFS